MGHASQLNNFLTLHKDQLVLSGVPERFWSTINDKLQHQTFNSGEVFQLVRIGYDEARQPHEPIWGLQATSSIEHMDSKHIYLIDHAWTFRIEQAKEQLQQISSLRQRLCNILDLDENEQPEMIVESIFEEMWRIVNTYSIGNASSVEERLPIWYVMDEIGLAVMHNDTPNCRIVPFVDVNTSTTYSLLFPTKDIDEDEFVFRDFAEGISAPTKRAAALLPWKPSEFHYSFNPEMPGEDYYLSGHIAETLPSQLFLDNYKHPNKMSYKVYTKYEFIKQYLTDEHFEIVDNEKDADILWYTKHFKDYANLSECHPEKFINQFPFEYVITIKDLLCLTCRRAAKDGNMQAISWFPITYNLQTEIAHFLSYFQHRQNNKPNENYWIAKPYNLARSLDVHITNNLNYLMRLPVTGPKIVQEYISNPVLFNRPEVEGAVKFDIRYVLLVKSVRPLKAYIYNEFFLRFANKPYELKDFHVYEKHFTVMNYNQDALLKKMLCSEFKSEWQKNYPHFTWQRVEEEILKMLKEILVSATSVPPPCGMAASPQSRALYAVDLMLAWSESMDIQPKILEINWTPDCKRACEYYPQFYNDIFKLLFLDKESESFTEL